jgi:8-amino-7-oxononanoate synthase
VDSSYEPDLSCGPDSLDALLKRGLSRLTQSQLLRERRVVRALDAVHVQLGESVYANFCSNNYLGLTHHPRVIGAMRDGAQKFGAGSGAAGLISGYSEQHLATEAAIAKWKGYEAAVLLPSGYQANFGAIQTLAAVGQSKKNGTRFLVDKLAHASLLDAVRGCDAAWRVFPHNGMRKLVRLLDEAEMDQLQVVVTESIFSMDGDEADLRALAELKKKQPFVLLVDEAHASGVYGVNGAGLAAERGVAQSVDVSIATFSKAAGCMGGAVCASKDFCRAVVNFGRAYIYSTEIAPAICGGIDAALSVMHEEPQRQKRVRELSKELRAGLKKNGWDVTDGESPIVPIILGKEKAAMEKSKKLLEKGLLVGAVRPPTVARGTSRLRVTVSCEHSDAEIDGLIRALGTSVK